MGQTKAPAHWKKKKQRQEYFRLIGPPPPFTFALPHFVPSPRTVLAIAHWTLPLNDQRLRLRCSIGRPIGWCLRRKGMKRAEGVGQNITGTSAIDCLSSTIHKKGFVFRHAGEPLVCVEEIHRGKQGEKLTYSYTAATCEAKLKSYDENFVLVGPFIWTIRLYWVD